MSKSIINYRAVKVTVWNDEKFFTLSDDAQLVWFHLYTNSMTNGLGLYHSSIEGLAADKRWSAERYRKGFMEGLGKGLFEYDETYHVMYFPNFLKHNPPANPNVLKGLLKVWDYIPSSPLKAKLCVGLKRLGKGFDKVTEFLPEAEAETKTGPNEPCESLSKIKSDINYRAVKVTIWNDEKFFALSDDAQLVWFHLYTNSLTNGLGLYHSSIEGLAADKRWPSKRYHKGLVEGLGKGLFEYDETYHVVYFPKFLKHNPPANPNVLKGLLKVWDYIPSSPLKAKLCAGLKRLGKGFDKVTAFLPETKTVTVTVTETVINKTKATPKPENSIKPARKKFTKPTFDELLNEFDQKIIDPSRQAQNFLNYYDSVGWLVGKGKPMRDWRASVRGWISRSEEHKTGIKESQADNSLISKIDELRDRTWAD